MKLALIVLMCCLYTFVSAQEKQTYTKEEIEALVEKKVEEKLNVSTNKPQRQLSENDQIIMDRGEISTGSYVAGGVLGTYLGFGIGHAVQGRYSDNGWKITLGETGGLLALIAGIGRCLDSSEYDDYNNRTTCTDGNGLIIVGALTFVGFRIYEIFDVWYGPYASNKRHKELTANQAQTSWHLIPIQNSNKLGLGIAYSF